MSNSRNGSILGQIVKGVLAVALAIITLIFNKRKKPF